MPDPKDLVPHLPHEGPPVPAKLPKWPATPRDIEEAVEKYKSGLLRGLTQYSHAPAFRTIGPATHMRMVEEYAESIPRAVEEYRRSLERRMRGY